MELEMTIGKSILAATLATLLLSVLPEIAHAQYDDQAPMNDPDNPHAKKKGKAVVQQVMFPKATRAEPKLTPSKIGDTIQKLFDLLEKDKNDEVIALAEQVLANPKASALDRAQADYVAGNGEIGKNNPTYEAAVKYLQQALTEDALPNNTHYTIMQQIAQMQLADEKYADALATATRFLSETQSDDPKTLALQGNALYRMDRYPEAVAVLKKAMAASTEPDNNITQLLIASYIEMNQPQQAAALAEQEAAKKPDDKHAQLNLVNVYMQADMLDKASQVFDRLRAKGLMTESSDYEAGYRVLASMDGREKDAIALINEGLDKKILTPSFDVYTFLGQSYYGIDQVPQAIDAWNKAAPLDKDGETYLNIAKLHVQEEHWNDAKASAHQALDKGVKKPGDAWMVIARAEFGLGNKPAVLAAYREAAKYPETQAQASKALKQSGAK
jgi:tetratricopeptide (TPR) repeat protein